MSVGLWEASVSGGSTVSWIGFQGLDWIGYEKVFHIPGQG